MPVKSGVFGYSCKELVQGELNARIDFILEPPVFWVETCTFADIINSGKSADCDTCSGSTACSCTCAYPCVVASTKTAERGRAAPWDFADRGG
jgi:hypothetical protein